MPRRVDTGRITSERRKLQKCLADGVNLETDVAIVEGQETYPNTVAEKKLGIFRPPEARKAVVADMERLRAFQEKGLEVPSFMEAGPRAELRFHPHRVRAAVVTTGGLAPGLHCVLHAIVKRHTETYGPNTGVFGIYNSFRGLCNLADNHIRLTSDITEEWLDQGGSHLGIVRYYHNFDETGGDVDDDSRIAAMADVIADNLRLNNIQILYVIGGDGSLRVVHEVAARCKTRSIVGIPKTMDNDILWVWQSFGFDTAVEQATQTINTLRSEAEATRRICLVELFGAESGFVAANAALASGHVDVVLIPEVFKELDVNESKAYLEKIVEHIEETVQDEPHNPHAVVVVAEGVETYLEEMGATIDGEPVQKDEFINLLMRTISRRVQDPHGEKMPVFINQPRHYVRAVPANAHDQIYCERLGALAVDNALAGYTGFMMSQWLTEYVLVPTKLVIHGQKGIPVNGIFWKQVVSSTRQPLSPAEDIS